MKNAVEINGLGKMYKLYDSTSEKMVDAFHLNKLRFWKPDIAYREFWALRNLDLVVAKGKRVGIIGKNGAGKSTLLKTICGNITPTEGSVKVEGKIQALMQLGTGFHPEFTGLENIRTSLSYNGISRSKIRTLEEEIIDFSELEDFINQPVKYYSSGMYSRLAFAVSTVLEPEIMIIDEVLGAGDAAFTTKCAERMKKLTYDTGATVLFVSHSMDSVLEICEDAILLERGQIVASGTALEISKIYNKKIRQEEELFLRAKEYKMKKRDVRAMAQTDEINQVLLFRFVSRDLHPSKKHKIYSCYLKSGDQVVGEINIGAPMDNDINAPNRIIDGKGFMDWGKSEKDVRGFFRYYLNENGINGHAPFQITIPRHMLNDTITLHIEAENNSAEEFYVEYWKENDYLRIGTIRDSTDVYEFSIPMVDEKDRQNQKPNIGDEKIKDINIQTGEEIIEDEKANESDSEQLNEKHKVTYDELVDTNSLYGSGEVKISSIDILDKDNQSRRTFVVGEKLTFVIDITTEEIIPKFVIVASILNTAGKPMGQVYCSSEDLGIDKFRGREQIKLSFDPLRLGMDEYMVSIGLFKEYDLSTEKENESYAVADRAIFFKVRQPATMKKGIGALAHICEWSCKETKHFYDATAHYEE